MSQTPWAKSSIVLGDKWKSEDEKKIQDLQKKAFLLQNELDKLKKDHYNLIIHNQILEKQVEKDAACIEEMNSMLAKKLVSMSCENEPIIRISDVIELMTGFKLTTDIKIKNYGKFMKEEMLKCSESFKQRMGDWHEFSHVICEDEKGQQIRIVRYLPEDLPNIISITKEWIKISKPSMFVDGQEHVDKQIEECMIPDLANIVKGMME